MRNFKPASKYILTIILLISFSQKVGAFDYQSRETLGYDSQISDQNSTKYANPDKIVITQIQSPSQALQSNPQQWIASLYYYSITRMSFVDIPYNFILDEYGQIYEGRAGGVGANPELDILDGTILIGYLSNDQILSTRAERSLQEMVEDLSYQWGIQEYSVVDLKINKTENSISTISTSTIENDFSDSINDALKEWSGYETEHIEYKAEITNVEYESEVEIGSALQVKVSVKNNNTDSWFTDKNPIYISTIDNTESDFAINGEWDSFSKPAHITENIVEPGGTVDISFRLLTKINPGEVITNFNILKFNDQPFENSDFEVKFNIVKGDNKLVEVYSPQYGFVNIRECPQYNCDILESVNEGAVYIEKAREGNWVKIKYDEDTDGWIYAKYIKSI
jgi:hypothetical protein